MPYSDDEIILLKDGASFAVYEADGVPVVATRVGDPALPRGLSAFGVGYGRAGEATSLHRGMPVEIVRDFCRAHGGVESGGEVALAILRRMAPAPAPPPPMFSRPHQAPTPTGRGSRAAKAAAQEAAYYAAVPSAKPKWIVPNIARPTAPVDGD